LTTPSIYRAGPHKLFFHPTRVLAGLEDRRTPPISLDIDLTTKCQLRCSNCTYAFLRSQSPKFLETSLAMEALDQAAAFGVTTVTLTGGGESRLHKDIVMIVSRANELGLEVGLLTNGVGFTEEEAEQLLPNLLFVRFSLTSKLEQDNVKSAVRVRARDGLSTGIGLSALVAGPDEAYFRRSMGWGGGVGADFIQYKPMSLLDPGLMGRRYFEVEKLQAAEALLQRLQQEREWGTQVIISRFTALLETTYARCYGQQWSAVLGADGRLYVCCELKYKEHFALGDLHKQTFEEIWTSDHRAQVLGRLKPAHTCFPGCKMHEINIVLAEMKEQATSREELIAAVNARHAELLQMSNGQIPAGVNFV